MFGGAKINELFEYEFQKQLSEVDIFEKTKDLELYWAIKNKNALRQTIYFNSEVFEEYASKGVEDLKAPCLMCLARVQDEMRQIVQGRFNKMSYMPIKSLSYLSN